MLYTLIAYRGENYDDRHDICHSADLQMHNTDDHDNFVNIIANYIFRMQIRNHDHADIVFGEEEMDRYHERYSHNYNLTYFINGYSLSRDVNSNVDLSDNDHDTYSRLFERLDKNINERLKILHDDFNEKCIKRKEEIAIQNQKEADELQKSTEQRERELLKLLQEKYKN